MDKIIKIDGRDVKFRATARTPRLYRALTGRDMIADMNRMQKRLNEVKDGDRFDVMDLQIFEDMAYIMARHADPEMETKTSDDWLDTFDMLSIYEVLPELMKLWKANTLQTSTPKKK